MATKTTNYNLELPEDSDFYSVHVQNENNRKIDSALQENKNTISKHENKTAEHLQPEQAEKIESALQPIQTFTEGNFVKVNSDGTISDSGFSENSFANTDHNEKSVYSEKGVHNFRYHDEKFQIFDGVEWIDATAKSIIQVQVNVDRFTNSSTITATNGTDTVTGETINGVCSINIPYYDTWTFTANSSTGEISHSETLIIDTVKLYTINLNYYYGTVNITLTNTINYYTHNNIKFSYKMQKLIDGVYTDYMSTPDNFDGGYSAIFNDRQAGSFRILAFSSLNPSVPLDYKDIELSLDNEIENVTLYFKNLKVNGVNINIEGTGNFLNASSYKVQLSGALAINGYLYVPLPYGTNGVFIEYWNNNPGYPSFTISKDDSYIELTSDYTERNIRTYTVYTVVVDLKNPDPTTNVINHSIVPKGITACCTPYSIKNDGTFTKLKENDFNYNADNSSREKALLTNPTKVMIKFNRWGLKTYRNVNSETGINEMVISVTDCPNAQGYRYDAFINKDGDDIDCFFLGAYTSGDYQGYIRTETGLLPKVSTSLATFRDTFGDYYDVMGFYQLQFIKALWVIYNSSLDSQSVGYGYTYNNEKTCVSGTMDKKGMNYFGNDGIKFCGLEHIFGNVNQLVDGIILTDKNEIKVSKTNLKDSNTYNIATINYESNNGFISDVILQDSIYNIDLLPQKTEGSSSTYFCDYAGSTAGNRYGMHGGDYASYQKAGIFAFNFSPAEATTSQNIGARIMYRPSKDTVIE